MLLNAEADAKLQQFINQSSFPTSGAVITDLDGTAVHEYQGKIVIPKEVELGLMHHYQRGRPLILNSLRFPLSVIRTFGQEWYKLSNAPIPTVTLNGSLVGFVKKTDEAELIFEQGKHKLLTGEDLKELSRVIESAKSRRHKASLNHSDLRLKNVIVDEGGDIAAIIDWEECISTIAPEWELSIALHDLTIDEKQAFIEGYGLSNREVEEMAPLIKAFNVLNYYQAIQAAIEAEDDKSLDAIRLRLNGSFDLYSL